MGVAEPEVVSQLVGGDVGPGPLPDRDVAALQGEEGVIGRGGLATDPLPLGDAVRHHQVDVLGVGPRHEQQEVPIGVGRARLEAVGGLGIRPRRQQSVPQVGQQLVDRGVRQLEVGAEVGDPRLQGLRLVTVRDLDRAILDFDHRRRGEGETRRLVDLVGRLEPGRIAVADRHQLKTLRSLDAIRMVVAHLKGRTIAQKPNAYGFFLV